MIEKENFIPSHSSYCDLNFCIDPQNQQKTNIKFKMLYDLGYDVFALNVDLPTTANKKSLPQKLPVPLPKVSFDKEKHKTATYGRERRLIQLSRITVELDNEDDIRRLSAVLEEGKFDLVAVKTRRFKMFELACTSLDVDIICVDCEQATEYPSGAKQCQEKATARGVYFEISYAPMLRQSDLLMTTLCEGLQVSSMTSGSSCNLIMSSGPTITHMDFRSPNDVANLSLLFKIQQSAAVHTVRNNPRAVIVHSYLRKTKLKRKRNDDDAAADAMEKSKQAKLE